MKWPDDANRISDKIIDMLRKELRKPGFDVLVAQAGLCLGMLGYMKTAPADNRPPSFTLLEAALLNCVEDMKRNLEKNKPERVQ